VLSKNEFRCQTPTEYVEFSQQATGMTSKATQNIMFLESL